MAEHGRRLKHWGWGYEDQQRPRAEVEQAAAGIREMLGFGGGETGDEFHLELRLQFQIDDALAQRLGQ